MMTKLARSLALLGICAAIGMRSITSWGEPLNGSQEIGTSISHSYEARNIFTNPAALGFDTALNGTELLGSFAFGVNKGFQDDYSVGLTLGYFGFGWEGLSFGNDRLNRYSLGLGFPISSELYFGGRYVLNRSSAGSLGHFDSVDLGLQYRPTSFLSLGLMSNRLNQPTIGGVRTPIQYVAGVTVRPVDRLDLSIDTDTSNDAFAKQFGYQATAVVEPIRGLFLSAGYHNLYHFQFGLQLNLGRAALFSTAQPGSSDKQVVSGVMLAGRPHPSVVHPLTALLVQLDGSLGEEAINGGLLGHDRPAYLDLLLKLKRAQKDPSISLVIVKLDGFSLGLAAAQELFETLYDLRQAGKRIVVFLGQGSLKEYLIACAANTIVMEPSGELRFLGPKAERYFLKGTMDKIGVEGEFLARGEYKSAPEMFTRKESSPLTRDATLSELQRVEEEFLPLLKRGRGITPERWHKALVAALYSAGDAKAAGLVDVLAHAEKELERIRREYVVDEDTGTRSRRLSLPPRVAVIVAEGDILERRIGVLSLGGEAQVTPSKMERHFKEALGDPRTKAIVLRVSSPGGEVLASDEIAGMIERARKIKPVIVSMGDVAASGGYMISAPAERIFAEPLTVTGSVGVFLGKFNLAGLFKKIDLQKEILSYAPFASLYSEDRPLTNEGREILVRRLNQYYDGFVSYVAKNRGISKDTAETAAKGRVWLGEQARQLKLTDERGGYRETLKYAASRAGLSEDYEVWLIEDEAGLFQLFGEDGWLMKQAKAQPPPLPLSLLSPSASRELRWIESLRENPFLYLSPVERFE